MEDVVVVMPQEVVDIISRLEEKGCEAYAVGGCIRDSLLNREPDDWDITTSALPMQVKSIFKRTIDTGIKHGTVTIMIGKTGYEVTTYRIDGKYEDGRHPESVEFSVSLIDDLQRRDFTINAMAYNDKSGLVDEFNGIEDLNNKLVRCVGNPEDRFSEDALRMMRAIRFSAQLGFEIEEKTFEAISKLASSINKVSRERIHVELNKTLLSDNPDYVEKMSQTGLTKEILPVIDKVLKGKKKIPALTMLKNTEKTLVLRYAALLNSADYEEVNQTMKDLKLDNYTIATVTKLVKLSGLVIEENEFDIREAMYKHGREFIGLLIKHQTAIVNAMQESTGIMMTGAKKHMVSVNRLYNDIIANGDCISVKDLDINGSDLMELGYSGPQIGVVLDELLHIVMENPKLNDKVTLVAIIENK